jgi:transposase
VRHIIYGSNNADTFAAFISELKAVMPRCVVVMDNLAVPRAKKVMDLFDGVSFVSMFLPPYSSALNPIERLWAVIKGKWRRAQHREAIALDGACGEDVANETYKRLDELLCKYKH